MNSPTLIPATREDREAAAGLHGALYGTATPGYAWILAGEMDDDYAVQAFAAHRLTALEPLVEAGTPAVEILVDYIEFLHRLPADELELHPYIPAVEEAFDRLSAALAKIGGTV